MLRGFASKLEIMLDGVKLFLLLFIDLFYDRKNWIAFVTASVKNPGVKPGFVKDGAVEAAWRLGLRLNCS
ncbi:hypothetical protein B7990_10480 [Fibrobacter sp. UWB4]|nr:hypothetical protein B7990_10480 [Fibrobacter sp. UWB4]